MIRPVTEFRNRHIKLFQGGSICQGSKYVSTFLVGVFKADDFPPSNSAIFSQQCDMLFSRLKLNKGLFTSFFDMGKWIRPSLSKYTTLFLSCNYAEKRGFQRGIPRKKVRTTEACDERHNTKLLSFRDKKIQGQKENYFDTKRDKTPS